MKNVLLKRTIPVLLAAITLTVSSGLLAAEPPVSTPAPKQVTSIELPDKVINLNIGDTYLIKPVISPSDASISDCKIQSSDSHVASSDTSGLVTANYIGTTNITISSITNPSVSKTIRVNITDDFTPPEGFDVRDSSVAKGDIVLDNLYASGQMEETIVVFPHGIINYNAGKLSCIRHT